MHYSCSSLIISNMKCDFKMACKKKVLDIVITAIFVIKNFTCKFSYWKCITPETTYTFSLFV